MATIYVVIGRVGEYSDAREWCVRAFVNKTRAEAFARDATEHYARLAADEGFRDRVGWSELDAADLAALAKYDATLIYVPDSGPNAGKTFGGSWTYSGDGPSYTVQAVTFDTVIA